MNLKPTLSRLIPLVLILSLVASCASPKTASPLPLAASKLPIVIDTDMGEDDIMAILYLLQRPDVSVLAITVSGTGMAHCEPGVNHALSLLAIAGKPEIPVSCGRETPLKGEAHFPADWREYVDTLPGFKLPQGGSPAKQNAVSLISSLIQTSPRPVVLVTLGPLTNVGEVLQANHTLVSKIKGITISGGAVTVPGSNISGVPLSAPNTTAEWNIFVDPHAANIVLQSGAPVTLVPLDATEQVPMTAFFYKLLSQNQTTPAAKTVYDVFRADPGLYKDRANKFWDPLVAAVATDESLVSLESRKISVVEDEGPEIGRTKESDTGTAVRVALSADPHRFQQEFLETLNGGAQIAIDWSAENVTPTPPAPILTITFSSGNQCTLEGLNTIPAGTNAFNWIEDIQEYEKYGLAVVTLDPGKTIDDLQAWPTTDQPPWVQLVDLEEATPGSRSTLVVDVTQGPIYFVCFYANPETKFGALGPVEVGNRGVQSIMAAV